MQLMGPATGREGNFFATDDLGLQHAVDQDVVQYVLLATSAKLEKDLWEQRKLPPRTITGHTSLPGLMNNLWCKTYGPNPELCTSDIALVCVAAEKLISSRYPDADSTNSGRGLREILRIIEADECSRVD
jgi:hypothetical protein